MQTRKYIAITISILALLIINPIALKEAFSIEGYSVSLLIWADLLFGSILFLLYYSKKSKYAKALNWTAFILSLLPILFVLIAFIFLMSYGGGC
jgi:hypothetical protein